MSMYIRITKKVDNLGVNPKPNPIQVNSFLWVCRYTYPRQREQFLGVKGWSFQDQIQNKSWTRKIIFVCMHNYPKLSQRCLGVKNLNARPNSRQILEDKKDFNLICFHFP